MKNNQDELKEVIFSLSRDEWVRQNSQYQIHSPLLGKLSPDMSDTCAMPPCAIQPFLGFATYFAPLCYVYKSRGSLYTMSRTMFCQLWCRLNVLSGDANTLLPVCKTFEVLLLQTQPQLFMHMVNIGLQPLKVMFVLFLFIYSVKILSTLILFFLLCFTHCTVHNAFLFPLFCF